ncbi:hypothetical protein Pelo_19433 [Pelomyxa schiedti]|nr:hypothetical protein Pelo_19433 [Pelomyxa schiedti]
MDEGRIKVLTDWKAPTQWKGDLENEFVVRDGVLFHTNAVKKKIKLCQALCGAAGGSNGVYFHKVHKLGLARKALKSGAP